MEYKEAIDILLDRTQKRGVIAKKIGINQVTLSRIISGNIENPSRLVKQSIINWAETQINKP